ncbi:MAG: hypothetical protein KF819_21395 [Labilithrix sp.]|nr:hypothetical protein [Labilithrix sp.]
MGRREKPYGGVDLASARKKLSGAAAPRFHTDWLAVDLAGRYAIFLGDDTIPLPSDADAEGTSKLVDEIRASFAGFPGASVLVEAYRSPAHRAREPVFDVPCISRGEPLHEERFAGYPHLVIATPDGAALVRQALTDLGGREALTRGPFAVVVDDLGPMTYEELHEASACDGCRVLDDPRDPRARSPELLASVGLYVYGWSGWAWIRITSPGVPADRDDLEAVGGAGVSPVTVEFRHDDTAWLRSDLVPE